MITDVPMIIDVHKVIRAVVQKNGVFTVSRPEGGGGSTLTVSLTVKYSSSFLTASLITLLLLSHFGSWPSLNISPFTFPINSWVN